MLVPDITTFAVSILDLRPQETDNDDGYNTNSNTYWYDPSSPHETDPDPFQPEPNETDMEEDDNYGTDSRSSNATGSATSASTSGISVWTVYIIVGSVAGGILLAGLVAIAIALCCQKEEDAQYKSTSV